MTTTTQTHAVREARERVERASAVLNGFRRRREDAITRRGRMFDELARLCEQAPTDKHRARVPTLIAELREITEAICESYRNGEEAGATAELATALVLLQSLS
jgi:hypothetical protein